MDCVIVPKDAHHFKHDVMSTERRRHRYRYRNHAAQDRKHDREMITTGTRELVTYETQWSCMYEYSFIT